MILNRMLSLACLALLSGCQSIPQTELTSYRTAFTQSKNAAQDVLLDYSQAVDETEKRRQVIHARTRPAAANDGDNPAFPQTLSLPQSTQPIDSVAARVQAIDAIARYNDLLANLAEGKSVSQVQNSVAQLVSTAASFATVLPAVGPLVNDVFGALEKARTQEEFKRSLQAGRPVVDKILSFLIDDAPSYYTVRLELVNSDTDVIKSRIAQRIGALKRRVEQSTSSADWGSTAQQINDELKKIGGLRGIKDGLQLQGKCTSACVVLGPQDLTETVLAIQQDVINYQQVSDKMNAYYNLLQHYVHLLDVTRQAMNSLNLAVDKPQNVESQIQEIVRTTLLLRKDFLQFRTSQPGA